MRPRLLRGEARGKLSRHWVCRVLWRFQNLSAWWIVGGRAFVYNLTGTSGVVLDMLAFSEGLKGSTEPDLIATLSRLAAMQNDRRQAASQFPC